MVNLKEIQSRLKQGNIAEVSRATGVSLATLYNIAAGTNDNPRLKTVELLENYLSNKSVDTKGH